MKIGILTQPLGHNYGGVLQNYALQTVLKRMGHDVYTINHGSKYSCFQWLVLCSKNIVKRVLRLPHDSFPILPHKKRAIGINVSRFIDVNIVTTRPSNRILPSVHTKYGFEAYVAGSDQVWRPVYNKQLEDMYLKFTYGYPVKRIAYAASFGVDNWEYTSSQTEKCAGLAQQFDLITVRENSAVELCEKHLGVRAHFVLDPTLLLSQEDYLSLLKSVPKPPKRQLTAYILDMDDRKRSIIENTARQLDLSVVYIGTDLNKVRNIVIPSIEEWIAGFANADLVITDSFHGTVFSIIFNKPFHTFFNSGRGNTRMQSLMSILGTGDRLIDCDGADSIDGITPIDWSAVNSRLEHYKNHSLQLLSSSLS